ncbi:MAG TPA: indole-3-glycerol phosphate synthase TrpC [Methylomusa anaerophila]|uniref:indole-3-glycerol-phosphate synthase n=1 Tax=Methylomusa anaerophila TaxID=1930071 RepID=A0A348ANR3_9FIRM|nr:indole-3-glycerol phosphate synthase TrpC [Methylomusa anaerophila]BBB92711.1 indole-3-glycerol phosphate synthase [Methylomusa anaerophila]HML87436.1 indole-3-glycerol phosphate synthase TrpC [Methylomusa anaerophila]
MLKTIVEQKRQEVDCAKLVQPATTMAIQPASHEFAKAIQRVNWALIAECKLASPVKGRLCTGYTVPELAEIYAANGAAALSVHTDRHFCGHLQDIAKVRETVALPILRKDFIIDPYQIYEARAAGAHAILLIAAILTDEEILSFLAVAAEMGMDCLVETHSREELKRVIKTPANIVGINNRDLKTFTTSIENTFDLLPDVEPGKTIISESGIHCGQDALRLKSAGVRGILVGEGLVKAADIACKTKELALQQN